ncbi:hypothetical protein BDR22DRAFT_638429 [Usnea florida]
MVVKTLTRSHGPKPNPGKNLMPDAICLPFTRYSNIHFHESISLSNQHVRTFASIHRGLQLRHGALKNASERTCSISSDCIMHISAGATRYARAQRPSQPRCRELFLSGNMTKLRKSRPSQATASVVSTPVWAICTSHGRRRAYSPTSEHHIVPNLGDKGQVLTNDGQEKMNVESAIESSSLPGKG